jgi:hypothetical protein
MKQTTTIIKVIIISGGLKTYPNDFDKIALIKNFIDTASESQGQSPNNVQNISSKRHGNYPWNWKH